MTLSPGTWRRPSRSTNSGCKPTRATRSEEHTSELQSQSNLVCRLLLEKKKKRNERHQPRPLPVRQRRIHLGNRLIFNAVALVAAAISGDRIAGNLRSAEHAAELQPRSNSFLYSKQCTCSIRGMINNNR